MGTGVEDAGGGQRLEINHQPHVGLASQRRKGQVSDLSFLLLGLQGLNSKPEDCCTPFSDNLRLRREAT